jgi:hypothetical protein
MSSRLARVPGVRRVRHRARIRMSERPAVYLPFARHKYPGPSPRVLDARTEMVLDGYTRSASTFAVYALQLAQERPLRLAHHLHAPAQLMAGVRAGLPTLMVIREPRGTVLSQMVREPGVAMRDAIVAYVRFHECLRPYRTGMVVADFETVTHDLGAVIRRVNERFGLTLTEFTHSPEAVDECLAMIELRGRLSPRLLGFESGLVSRATAREEASRLAQVDTGETARDAWVPSTSRQQAKDALAEQWGSRRLAPLRRRAVAVYAEFTGVTALASATAAAHAGALEDA